MNLFFLQSLNNLIARESNSQFQVNDTLIIFKEPCTENGLKFELPHIFAYRTSRNNLLRKQKAFFADWLNHSSYHSYFSYFFFPLICDFSHLDDWLGNGRQCKKTIVSRQNLIRHHYFSLGRFWYHPLTLEKCTTH